MRFSYNWLQSFFKESLPKPKELAEILTMHSFEVEEIEKKGKDWLLDIDILPNRGGDCFSHLGIAREISALLGFELELEEHELKEQQLKTKDFVGLEVKENQECLRYTARVMTDVKISVSPKWLKDRLKVLGLKPINNIVDIANYIMLETGQPLHAFDLDKIFNNKIIVRKAKKGERILTLDNEAYELDRDVLAIADNQGLLAIAGIKGGKKAEITKKTKIIVLESANFDPIFTRKASKKIDLKTDASWRFEHGLDLNLTEFAVNRASALIAKVTRGKVCQGLIDFYPRKQQLKKIKLDLNYVQSLLGFAIPEKKVKEILKSLGFKLNVAADKTLLVDVPSFRIDVNITEDLIEEIGRVFGYENIPSVFPEAALISPEPNLEIRWQEMTKSALKEAGFAEIYTSSFVSKQDAKLFGFKDEQLIETDNPISADYQYLRPSLIVKVLKGFKENEKIFKEIKIFELGKVFTQEKDLEKKSLVGLISGESFYEVKGIIDFLLQRLGISDFWYDQYNATPEDSKAFIWNQRKSAEIKIGQEEIGFFGEISQKIKDALKLKTKAVVFDIDFEKLQKMISEEKEFLPISQYPSAVRDIALLVPSDVLVDQVMEKIHMVGRELIRDVDLFDIYEGGELQEGKKNLAFHIIYQADDRTLSSEEIEDLQDKIIKSLEENPEWEVRK